MWFTTLILSDAMTAVFKSHLLITHPCSTEIEFANQIDTRSRCYSIAWHGEKIVSGVGSSVTTFTVNRKLENEYWLACEAVTCVRNFGYKKLYALLIKDGGLDREVNIISQEKTFSSPIPLPCNTTICEFKQENKAVTLISVSPTCIAACDVDEKVIIIFNNKGEQVMRLGAGKLDVPHSVLLLDDFVLVTDRGENSCLAKYRLVANSEPVWTCYGLKSVTGVCTDKNGYIYVASADDETGGRIYLITPTGKTISTNPLGYTAWLTSIYHNRHTTNISTENSRRPF